MEVSTETKTETKTTKTKKVDERVEVFIPRGPANGDPNYFVSVNGKNFLLPRGKKSLVPPEVAAEIERAVRAQERLDERMDALREQSK